MKGIRPAIWSFAVLALAFLGWLAFVGNTSSQELALGAACAVFCAAVSLLTWKAMELFITFRLRDVLEMWRIPWNALQDSWLLTRALVRDLLGIECAGSHLRAVRFEEHHGRVGRLRHVLAVAYTSATPNSIVIGIDDPHQLLLLHQIVRSPISKMTRNLGARP